MIRHLLRSLGSLGLAVPLVAAMACGLFAGSPGLAMAEAIVDPARPVVAAPAPPVTAPGKADLGGPDRSTPAGELAARKQELDALTRDIAVSSQRRGELDREVRSYASDAASLTDQLTVTAAHIQDYESQLSDSEARLLRMDQDVRHLQARLDARKGVLAEVLGVLLRMGRKPPPALLVSPGDALTALRAAIVSGAVLPELRLEVDAMAADLAQMTSLREQIRQEEARLRAKAGQMADEKARLGLLLDEKKALLARTQADLAAEASRNTDLAGKAASLSDLVTRLDRQVRSSQGQVSQQARLALDQPFASTVGKLSLPVRGVVLKEFGADSDLEGTSQGISVATRAGARVTTPCDAIVMYAGPYRSYGQLLILDAGDGYHIVLAGLDHLDVVAGQSIVAGEPVGTMGDRGAASAAAADLALSRPVLYIEFRKNGSPIDPSPWWSASDDRKVNG